MKLVSRGLALVVIGVVVVGCAAGNAGSPNPGSGGAAGSAGSGTGTGGGGGCVAPPVVQVSWSLITSNDPSGPTETCAQAGVQYVEFFLDTNHTQFSCDAYKGSSTDFVPGTYTPRVLLTNASGTIVVQGTGMKAVTVPNCGVASIGGFAIVVPTTGAAGGGGSSGAAGSSGTGAGGSGGSSGTGGSGGGGTGGSSGTGTAGTGGGVGPCNALPIFATHSCASPGACHDAKGTSANFDMASPGWEMKLVGGNPNGGGAAGFGSQCQGKGPYLIAGSSPARGLFLDKLAAKPPCGNQMPLLPPTLTATELDCVQRWANGLTKP